MTDALKVRCPRCRAVLKFAREQLNQRVQCGNCTKSFRFVPRTEAVPVPPVANPEPAPSEMPGEPFDFASLSTSQPARVVAKPAVHPARGRWPLIGLALALAGAAAAYGYWKLEAARAPAIAENPPSAEQAVASEPEPADPPAKQNRPSAAQPFPRRFLLIGVHQYVYANPVAATPEAATMVRTVRDFAEKKLRVPKDQVAIVSDIGPEAEARAPLKPVIESAISQFCATCRPQDRIMIVFVGHAVERDEEAFLAPIEAELDHKHSLIPLSWVYQELAKCPARQKVLIVDVARTDTARGLERPGSGPMGAKLDAALAQPPPGVQVWTACTANQYSHEFEVANNRKFRVRGGAFLSLLMQAFSQGGNTQKPEDPLPMEFLENNVRAQLDDIVKAREKGARQTPRLVGREVDGGASFDPKAPRPPKLEIARPVSSGAVSTTEIQKLLEEVSVPSLRLPRDDKTAATPAQQAAALASAFPFPAETMRQYAADYQSLREILDKPKDFPLRIAVLNAVDTLDRQGRLNRIRVGDKEVAADRLIETVRNLGNDDKVKKSLTKSQQDGPALMLVELQDAHDELEKAGKDRGREPSKRWQAHYDYVLAQLKMRMAFVHEYNSAIAKVKRDELPKLDDQLHNGWRLAAQEKLQSPKEVRDLAADARKLLAKLAAEHSGTPWEVLAKRARTTSLGLAWQPTNLRVD